MRAAREVLSAATLVPMKRPLSRGERELAADVSWDPRVATALRHNDYGLAEYLSAGPMLEDEWDRAWDVGGHPTGAAIVAAAVALRRAGRTDPIPRALLEEVHVGYLERRGGARLRPESFEDGLEWACTPVHATSAMLVQMPGGYQPFAYLVDERQRIDSLSDELRPEPSTAPVATHAPTAPLTAGASRQRGRRQVTVLFTEVVDSTALGRRLEVERLSQVLERFYDVAREVLERHGGRVQKYLGDAVMAVFGLPQVRIDDPLRAVRAAVELHARVRDLNPELRRDWGVELTLHTAISTGDVMVEDDVARNLGIAADHVTLVAELIRLAGDDSIVLANTTYQLVRGAVRVETVVAPSLLDGAERVVRVLEVSEQAVALRPMIGREWDIESLRFTYEGALRQRSCYLLSVHGAPGIGKTRLVEEFVRRLSRRPELSERPYVLRGLCPRPGADAALYPIRQIIRQAAGIHGDAPEEEARRRLSRLVDGNPAVVARLAPLIGLPGHAAEPADTVRAICHALEAAAKRAPLVVVVDDLHWAEPPLLDVLERVKARLTDVPVLIIAVSREEPFDEDRDWAGWERNTGALTISPLSPAETEQMIGQILQDGDPDPEVVTTVVEAAGAPRWTSRRCCPTCWKAAYCG